MALVAATAGATGKWGLTSDKQRKGPTPWDGGGSGSSEKKEKPDPGLEKRKIKSEALAALLRLWGHCWSRGACRKGKDRFGTGEKGAGRAEATSSARPLGRAPALSWPTPPGSPNPTRTGPLPSPVLSPASSLPSLAHFSQLTHNFSPFSPHP